jgi:hypothetical protein
VKSPGDHRPVRAALESIAASLGYSLGPNPEARENRPGVAWWFYREGADFRTECLTFRLEGGELETHFFGSMMPPDELERTRVSGNVAGYNLFIYQVYHLDSAPADLLPQAVDIRDEATMEATLSRLRSEITRADISVWQSLWRAWMKHLSSSAERGPGL